MIVTSASAPGPQGALVKPQHFRRVDRHLFDRLRPGEMSGLDQLLNHQRAGRFQPDDSERRAIELLHFLSGACGAWSVQIQSIVPSASPVMQACIVALAP